MASAITSSSRILLLVLVAISLICSNARSPAGKEYLELKRKLEFLNKPAVKSIQTEHGDIFDCVDMYKQPAFDHPLLKNHTIQVHGTRVTMNVWGPILQDQNQFSLAQLWIVNGPRDQLNTIEAGWTVLPQMFGDSVPRLFVYWTANGYKGTGCYNLICAGFVQVSRDIPVGSTIQPTSTYDGYQKDITLQVYKDPNSGDWWLTIGDNNAEVGYWPNSLFTSLADSGSTVQWGGEVYTLESTQSPQMGSGHFPDEGFRKASYMKKVMFVDNTNTLKDIPDNTPFIQDVPQCYRVIDGGNLGGDWGRHIYFGGPGGCSS